MITIGIPTRDRPLVLTMNPTAGGKRLDGVRVVEFVHAELVDCTRDDFVYHLADSDGALWLGSVSVYSDRLWLLVDGPDRYWIDLAYPVTSEEWRR